MSKSENNFEVTKDITVADLLKNAPKAMEVFFRHGMYCVGCPIASGETVEQAAISHGLDPDEMIREIQEALK